MLPNILTPADLAGCLAGQALTRHGDTIFIPLPRALWQPFSDADPETGLGLCCCAYCSPEVNSSRMVAAWDTLAISASKRRGRNDTTWQVHYPELHGKRPLRPVKG